MKARHTTLVAATWATLALSVPHVNAEPAWADPGKTVRVMFPVAETGFDPQAVSDLYSSHVLRGIFEPLITYDYLARPYKLVPLTAAAMPEISPDGRTWTIRVRPGTFFSDDAAFKGKRRELVAQDYVYSWKRLLDPRMRSPYLWYLDGKLIGADKVLAKAKETGRLDYDAEIEGLKALDKYTLQLKLVEPDYVLVGYMSHSAMSAVAREVIEAHGDQSGWAMANPVGTGPFRLKEWRRGQKITLEANPGYRVEYFPTSGESSDAAMIARMKGKRLPQIGRIDISIIEESNPQLLAFNARELDYANVPGDLTPNVLDANVKLKREYADAGVRHYRSPRPSLAYMYFNMEDPIVGGYTPDKVALRRAIIMAFNVRELIDVFYQGQAIEANQPIPPVVSGHVENLKQAVPYDPELAKALLDRFGYKDRDGDGFREMPDGKPLALVMGSSPASRDRTRDELWKKSLQKVGIRIDFLVQKWPDLLKMGRAGKLQMWPVGWITAYNEGDAFMQLLYSKNIGQSNYSRFTHPEYDTLYKQTKQIPAGPERTALYRKMFDIVNAQNPWDLGVWQIENTLVRPWVDGYKKHAFIENFWKYYDIDLAKRGAK
ncbi:MAG TPA: ABC transporter substrate-binding protein [Casimicrobiaceae bacterium]|nr:ABC transporter substrate-binding protein [Casimicrobiaceae bacterium]